MKHIKGALYGLAALTLWGFLPLAYADEQQNHLHIITSIKPIDSLVRAVAGELAEPILLIENRSPHDYHLKPSQMQKLQQADVIFWVGEDMESFLPKALHSVGQEKNAIALSRLSEMKLNPLRTEKLRTENMEHDEHHDEDDDEDAHQHGHNHGRYDMHIWLDPQRAIIMVKEIAAALILRDEQNQSYYQARAENYIKMLERLDADIASKIAVKTSHGAHRRFLVFHDAWQYYEKRYGISNFGVITLNPEIAPSAGHIAKLQKNIQQNNVACLFAEPQFSSEWVKQLAQQNQIQLKWLDPLGDSIPHGEAHYVTMMKDITDKFIKCL